MLDTFEIREGVRLADRYTVVRRLGTGGMATVFLAEDEVLGRPVALKFLRGGEDADLRRFRREARLGASLSHPNLVTVFDTIADDDGVLIVMEYVPGETLADALDRGPVDPDEAVRVLRPVAAALDHAHSRGVVHRDVKPANVLLGEDGAVKLADLGIATAAEATRITTVNDVVGTLAYIAPERLESATPGGPGADVYALGALAYETLGGVRLDRGSTPAEVLQRAAVAPPPDLRDVRPDLPVAAAQVLQRAMDREPRNRPAGAGELVDELEDALRKAEGPTQVAAAAPVEPTAVHDRGRGIPRAAIAAVAAMALAAAIIVAVVIASDGGGERSAGPSGLLADDGRPQEEAAPSGGGKGNKEPSGEAAGAPAEDAAAGPAPAGEDAPAAPENAASGDPAALNDQGYALIQSGRPDEAIPILQQAVDSYPEGSRDLTYAYALYNLGQALRLAGRPDEAIPVLERRLEIPNQRGVVRRELELARADAAGG